MKEGSKQLMVGRSHRRVSAGIGQQAGFLKLREAMGEESGQIACIDQLTARITGQPLGAHHRTCSVGWVEILGGHMAELVNVGNRCIATDLVGRGQAKRKGVIPGRRRRT